MEQNRIIDMVAAQPSIYIFLNARKHLIYYRICTYPVADISENSFIPLKTFKSFKV